MENTEWEWTPVEPLAGIPSRSEGVVPDTKADFLVNGTTLQTLRNPTLDINGKTTVFIGIVNDNRLDGDNLLTLTIFGSTLPIPGFSQEIYSFKEGDPTPGASSLFESTNPYSLDINNKSQYKTAYIVIEDDDKPSRKTYGKDQADFIDLTGLGNHDITNDLVYAKAGNDIVYAGKGNDIVFGEQGNDSLWGNEGDDYVIGGDGNDYVNGGDGNDYIDGGVGVDLLEGGTGNDIYVVDNKNDKIIESPGTGIETVRAFVDWTLTPGLDHLTLVGFTAITGIGNNLNNEIKGNFKDNLLDGGAGNDTLLGGNGNDTLVGGEGNDTLIGGKGNDTLTGGSGADIFKFNYVYTGTTEGIDVITDFNWMEGDKIQISKSGYDATSTNQFNYNSSTGALFFDASPSDSTAPTQIATLQPGISFISSVDIILV